MYTPQFALYILQSAPTPHLAFAQYNKHSSAKIGCVQLENLQRLLLPASDTLTRAVRCPPEMLCQVISSVEMRVCAVAHAQLAGEVAVMHMLPQLLSTEEVDIAETTVGMGRRQMGL